LAKLKHRHRYYRMFNTFPLNLTSIQHPHRIYTGPRGFITVPISIPYPWRSPYSRQPSLYSCTRDKHTFSVSNKCPLLQRILYMANFFLSRSHVPISRIHPQVCTIECTQNTQTQSRRIMYSTR